MRTSDHRKAIPVKIKLAVLVEQARCAVCGERLGLLAETRFDHRPALVNREWDAAAGDFIPPQLSADHIDACHVDCHLYRTSGRRPGAAKTATSANSDIAIAAKAARIARKLGGALPARVSGRPAPSRWPKGRKLSSRAMRRTA